MQKNTIVSKRLIELNGRFEKVISLLNSAKNSLIKNDNIKFETYLEKALLSSESTVLSLRDTAKNACSLNNSPLSYERMMSNVGKDIHKIRIQKINNGYKIVLPGTLNHYGNISKSLLDEPLNNMLRTFNKETKIQKIDHAVMLIVNCIEGSKNKLKIRDNDNYEYKQIINTIAFWMLKDDGYDCCDIMNCTKISDKNVTEVYLISKDKFCEFYSDFKK